MSYIDVKNYLDTKSGPLTSKEIEYINLKLKSYDTNILLFKLSKCSKENSKTSRAESIQIKNIVRGRLSI